MALDIIGKLAILADAAKYDASCASSGTTKRSSVKTGGIGSTEGSGICHSYSPDGRCISLLKVLLTNVCLYDCSYCINRASSGVRRARFTPEEVVKLTLDFYRRNYIEGLFLSSGVIRSPDYTMEQIVRVARALREEHAFRGYIHLKTVPDASPELVREAGRYADRLSINVELPSAASLARLAPGKSLTSIRSSMRRVGEQVAEAREERRKSPKAPRFCPAGQSTQMIVGADASTDVDILTFSSALYSAHRLRRVYYSAFSPIPDASALLPLKSAPLIREHRLYQADWLTRFYGFGVSEIAQASRAGMLDLAIDPKLAWALQNRHVFPVDLNRSSREMLWRVPGLGTRVTAHVLATRAHRLLRLADLARLTRNVKKMKPFISTVDWHPGSLLDSGKLGSIVSRDSGQLDLFAA